MFMCVCVCEREREREREILSVVFMCCSCSRVAGGESAVIGFVEPPGVWLVVVNGSIACLNINYPSAASSNPLLQLSMSSTRKEVKQLLQDIHGQSRSRDSMHPAADSDCLYTLHNLTET